MNVNVNAKYFYKMHLDVSFRTPYTSFLAFINESIFCLFFFSMWGMTYDVEDTVT